MYNPTIVYKKFSSGEELNVTYNSNIVPTSGKIIINKKKYSILDIEYNYDNNKITITLH